VRVQRIDALQRGRARHRRIRHRTGRNPFAVEQGKQIAVFADETRPYLQARGHRVELQQEGIDVTLITTAWRSFFSAEEIRCRDRGGRSDRGQRDTANKIGTYTVAVLANAHEVPFYVAAPFSTIDVATKTGEAIPIEERSAAEVTDIGTTRIAPDGISVRHPAFDVTPARLITRSSPTTEFSPAIHQCYRSSFRRLKSCFECGSHRSARSLSPLMAPMEAFTWESEIRTVDTFAFQVDTKDPAKPIRSSPSRVSKSIGRRSSTQSIQVAPWLCRQPKQATLSSCV